MFIGSEINRRLSLILIFILILIIGVQGAWEMPPPPPPPPPPPIDSRPQNEVQVGPDKLEVVASFCYLGDMLSVGGGCEIAVTTGVKTAWKKFRELLPVLTSRHLSFKTMYTALACGASACASFLKQEVMTSTL